MCRKSNSISQSFIMGMAKTNAKIYWKYQIHFVNLSFSDIFIFPSNRKITPSKATIPRTMQKGINLGYFIALSSNEITTEKLSKFNRQVIPKLKKIAFPNAKVGRIIKIDFFISKYPFYIFVFFSVGKHIIPKESGNVRKVFENYLLRLL